MSVSRSEIRRQWQERVTRFATSDLNVAEFCQQEGVGTASFYQWRRRLRDSLATADAPATHTPRFLPLVLAGAPPLAGSLGPVALELELPNQVRLRIARDVEARFVGEILATVAGLGPRGLTPAASCAEVR